MLFMAMQTVSASSNLTSINRSSSLAAEYAPPTRAAPRKKMRHHAADHHLGIKIIRVLMTRDHDRAVHHHPQHQSERKRQRRRFPAALPKPRPDRGKPGSPHDGKAEMGQCTEHARPYPQPLLDGPAKHKPGGIGRDRGERQQMLHSGPDQGFINPDARPADHTARKAGADDGACRGTYAHGRAPAQSLIPSTGAAMSATKLPASFTGPEPMYRAIFG